MAQYSELIKDFEKIRAYMREFYVYGIKSREDYKGKSSRTYDDERRRIESWIGEHMDYVRTPSGKNAFISIDSRSQDHNPLYNAFRAKSFTDGDITLHFILFDILYTPEVEYSLASLLDIINDEYLSRFDEPMSFDESTVRKKLKEYISLGLVEARKEGRRQLYRRTADIEIPCDTDALHLFSEIAPCGVIGAFLLDKTQHDEHPFDLKHHYITSSLDSDVLATLFLAMREKRAITLLNKNRRREDAGRVRVVPLRVFISVQSGRQHLLCYVSEKNCIKSFRIDYMSSVKLEECVARFDELRAHLCKMEENMFGVSVGSGRLEGASTERVSFTVKVGEGEDFIVNRLTREGRCGRVERISFDTYRYSAEVYDLSELIPWIRSFICRISEISFSNKNIEKRFLDDLDAMYKMYGIKAGDGE